MIRNVLSYVHVLNLVPTMLEIAFSGIEILNIFKGAHPKKFPRRRGPKALVDSVGYFIQPAGYVNNIIETPDPFFPSILPKEKYAH